MFALLFINKMCFIFIAVESKCYYSHIMIRAIVASYVIISAESNPIGNAFDCIISSCKMDNFYTGNH